MEVASNAVKQASPQAEVKTAAKLRWRISEGLNHKLRLAESLFQGRHFHLLQNEPLALVGHAAQVNRALTGLDIAI
jgi:hypothetical protein